MDAIFMGSICSFWIDIISARHLWMTFTRYRIKCKMRLLQCLWVGT